MKTAPLVLVTYVLREDYAASPVQVDLEASSGAAVWDPGVTPAMPLSGTASTFQLSQPVDATPVLIRLSFTQLRP